MNKGLQNLYEFISGTGSHEGAGVGLSSFPCSGPNLHRMCQELEAKGRIVRKWEGSGIVYWVPADE